MKKLHLVISVIVVLPVAIGYGWVPARSIPWLLDFVPVSTDQYSIFRALMCLYLFMALIWMFGIFKARYWEMATVTGCI